MSKKTQKRFTPLEKVASLRLHLLEHTPVSDLCDKYAEPIHPLDDRLDIRLGHRLPDFPVHDEPTAAIKEAAQVKERPGDVDVGNVNVPMLVRLYRLLEAFTLKRRLAIVLLHQPGIAEHAVNTGRAHCHDVGIKHYEGEPPIALLRILGMEINDGLFSQSSSHQSRGM
jgi:hypothetical protein